MSKKKYDPCKIAACRIQTCLKENNYQESRCLVVLEEMRQCCIKHKNEESLCCSGIILDRPYVVAAKTEEPKNNGKGRPK